MAMFTRSPSSALCPLLGEGFPTKRDYRKMGTLILTSLLEDVVYDSPYPRWSCLWQGQDAQLLSAPSSAVDGPGLGVRPCQGGDMLKDA